MAKPTTLTIDLTSDLGKRILARARHTRKKPEQVIAEFAESLPAGDSSASVRWGFSGTVDMPPSATQADVTAYLYDAIGTMVGCYRPPGAHDHTDPGHPVFGLDNVQIHTAQKVK